MARRKVEDWKLKVDKDVKQMLKEDSIVGRWARAHLPEAKFKEILKRAEYEKKQRVREMRQQ